MGLNTVQTYIMWNFHEHERGTLTWSGRHNLTHFIELASRHGLYVTLRIGPYVCGEYQFGGLPFWMRTLDDVKCFRCSDRVWEREMTRFVGAVVDLVRPQLRTAGGPVVMLQIENEYNGPDQRYLDWAVDMAINLTTQVPWNLCHDHVKCAAVNTASDGSHVNKVLCTINGFWMDEKVGDHSQPSPAWLSDLRSQNPGQPAIWTEDQGWFDEWGKAMRVRDPADQSYGIGRFFAYGGAWHNFYMLTGGNNYGRQAGGQVVTAYAPDTAIDYLLLRHEPRFSHYRALLRTLTNYSEELLTHPIPTPTPLAADEDSSSTTYLAIQPCTDTDPAHMGRLDASQQWSLTADGALQNVGSGLCVMVFPQQLGMVTLQPCEGSKPDPALRWAYNASSEQYVSVATAPCEASRSKGQLCHRCLDMDLAGGVDLWDCKSAGDATMDNQRWQPYSPQSGVAGIRGTINGLCLTVASKGGGGAEAHTYGRVIFLSNYGQHSLDVSLGSHSYHLPNRTICIVEASSKAVVWNSSDVWAHVPSPPPESAQRGGTTSAVSWSAFGETPGFGAHTRTSDKPLEMLALTNDDTDYLWYSVKVSAASASPRVSASGTNGAITYVYVDGTQQVATTAGEMGGDVLSPNATETITETVVRLDILTCAMGMSNSNVGPDSVKGLQSTVTVDGAPISSKTTSPWIHSWILQGEAQQIFTPSGTGSVEWTPLTPSLEANATIVWFKGFMDLPRAAPGATQTAYVLDLSTMNKGVAYVNGFNIGRYWLQLGECSGMCAPPVKSGHCYMHWKGCGRPTQTLYHIPNEVLKQTGNMVVLFEETANSVQRRSLHGVQIQALHEHPPFD